MDLDQIFFHNSLRQWITTLCSTVVLWLIFELVKYFTVKKVSKFAEKTETKLDDLAIALLDKTRFYFLLFVALYFSSKILILPLRVHNIWNYSIHIVLALQTIVWGNALIEFVLGKESKVIGKEVTASASYGVLSFVSRIVLWSTILLITLSNVGVNITAIVTGLGVGGIAVALAAQKILGDLFSSFIIVLDKPFEVGDYIQIDDFSGTVDKVGIKTTRFRSLTGEQLIIPNSTLVDSKLRNYKRMEERRVLFKVSVEYDTPYEKIQQIPKWTEAIIDEQEQTRFVYATFREYGESGLVYEIVYFVLSSDYNLFLKIQQDINLAIYRRFEQEGIRFALPVRKIVKS